MPVNYRNLLPKKMQDTRWSEFIDVFQNIFSQLKDEKMYRIFDQFHPTKSTNSEKIELAKTMGFNLLTLDGYTASQQYFDKQIYFLSERIVKKTTRKSYKIIGYIYNLDSDLYQVKALEGSTYLGMMGTIESEDDVKFATIQLDQEGDNILYITEFEPWELDQDTGDFIFELDGSTSFELDNNYLIYGVPEQTGREATTLDSDDFITLDAVSDTSGGGSSGEGTIITAVTRNLLFHYKHFFIENVNEFLSHNTLFALYNDVSYLHKATEVIYFEPVLEIEIKKDNSLTLKEYTDYEQILSVNQESILIGDESYRDKISYLRFGTGGHSVVDNTITDVETFSYQYPEEDGGVIQPFINFFDENNIPSNEEHFDFIIPEWNKFTEFSELAIYDIDDNIILYSKFPKIAWNNNMYNNIQINLRYLN